MGWRFRKRIKIAPGININISKNGVSTTVGPRGASVNIGKNGACLNTGVPGTGLYNRQKIGGGSSSSSGNYTSTSNDGSNGCMAIGLGLACEFIAIISFVGFANASNVFFLLLCLVSGIGGICLIVFSNKSPKPEKAVNTSSDYAMTPEVESENSNYYTPPSNLPTENYCGKYDPLFEEAAKLIVKTQTGSTSMVQRTFSIGYIRAGRLMDELERCGIVGPAKGATPRDVLVKDETDLLLITSRMVLEWAKRETSGASSTAKDCHELTREQFDLIKKEAAELYDFIMMVTRKRNVRKEIDSALQLTNNDDTPWKVADKVRVAIIADVYRCFKGLGHNFADDDDDENIGLYLFIAKYLNKDSDLQYETRTIMPCKLKELINGVLSVPIKLNENSPLPANEFFIQHALENYDKDLQSQYMVHLHRFASAVANADGEIDELERGWLAEIMKSKDSLSGSGSNVKNTESPKGTEASETPNEDLNNLIGLTTVKEEITRLRNFIKIQQEREKQGLKTSSISYHCVFTGNPGTGKTTVARIIAGIYKEQGILKKGQLIETDRSGLVAEYVGQTAVKTNKIIDSALDGVLFIDEAYSLVQGAKEDFGQEAISTLLKRMEDDRERLVVVLAGYGNEMKDFIDSNPGLQSRFNRYINFPDYNADELLAIYKKNLEKHQYMLTQEADTCISMILSEAIANKDKNFGNARFVRNLFEKTLENQAMRLASASGQLTSEMLCEIKIEDVELLKK